MFSERNKSIPILRVVMQRSQKMIQRIQSAGILFKLIDWRSMIGFGVSFLIVVFGFGMVEGALATAHSPHRANLSMVKFPDRTLSRKTTGDRTQATSPPLAPHQDFESSAANRLSHSDLTSAALTRNRLTGSHLFVDVPATPHAHHQ